MADIVLLVWQYSLISVKDTHDTASRREVGWATSEKIFSIERSVRLCQQNAQKILADGHIFTFRSALVHCATSSTLINFKSINKTVHKTTNRAIKQ